ncbi:hypothetical protein CFP56_032748 [Quercus suber]|uniref:Uncharacterized protein n=1 Tax=Quercus suber TaxID=58331 RepID=A0AAW0JFV3_QUESU
MLKGLNHIWGSPTFDEGSLTDRADNQEYSSSARGGKMLCQRDHSYRRQIREQCMLHGSQHNLHQSWLEKGHQLFEVAYIFQASQSA